MSQECLNCRHWRPKPPDDWEPPHEGAEYGLWAIRACLGDCVEWNAGVEGWCYLQPRPEPARSIHHCGQWAVNEYYLRTWYEIWEEERHRAKVKELETALKAARKLATERYHRLKEKPKVNGHTEYQEAPTTPAG